MIDQLNKEQLKSAILYVARKIVESEPYLTEIDLKIGDGDHGTGMKLGFSQVLKALANYEPVSCDDVFRLTGMTLLDTMGGASGVLFGTVFISGLTKRQPKQEFTLKDFAEIFSQSLDALKQRGKAKVGDKTMVDAFEPAVHALIDASSKDLSFAEGFASAAESARKGMELTKTLKARFGRAKYFGEKAIGLQDAGATSIYIIFRSMSEWIHEVGKPKKVVTVTLNPCIDRTIEIEKFLYGGTNKVLTTREDISGKGINVNLVLKHLSVPTLATGFDYINDHTKLVDFFKQIDCPYVLESVEGSLRVNVKIFDTSTSVMSEFNDRGGMVSEKAIDEYLEKLYVTFDNAEVIVVDGSVPPGVPTDIYARIIEEAAKRNVCTILDASGELLYKGIKAHPYLIKPNEAELAATYGVELKNKADIVKVARMAIDEGVSSVCVSRGSKGALYVTANAVYEADPIHVDVKGVQGAGDSMVAGFCYGLFQKLGERDLFAHAIACATGSLLHPGTELCEKQDMEAMLQKVVIRKLDL